MHNTRSAMLNLINRYKAVLDKCQLVNTFGSLALATSMTVTGTVSGLAASMAIMGDAQLAHAATDDYSPTLESVESKHLTETLSALTATNPNIPGDYTTWLEFINKATGQNYADLDYYFDSLTITDISPAYTVTSNVATDATGYYTKFTIVEANSVGSTTSTTYGVSLTTSTGPTDDINTLIGDYVESNALYSASGTLGVSINSETYNFLTPTTNITITNDTNTVQNTSTNRITSTGTSKTIYDNHTISGDFTGLSASSSTTPTTGGAISIQDHDVEGITITGNFVSNTSSGKNYNAYGGGAISITATDTDGDTAKVSGTQTSGAAVKIDITSISGNFIDNKTITSGSTTAGYGGAIFIGPDSIYSESEFYVGSIEGNFIGNEAVSGGGAIYLFESLASSYIGTISGNFLGNSAAYGGAITNAEGTIGSINANFIANTTTSGGGAFFNFVSTNSESRTAYVGTITGSFVENSSSASSGGAIVNTVNAGQNSSATIGIIAADFIGNEAFTYGGAIYNYAANRTTIDGGDGIDTNAASIGVITGDFILNAASEGGAIYNKANNANSIAEIGSIESNFIQNEAKDGDGGAIYNYADNTGTATIENIDGYFIENTAGDSGGAIYNYANSSGTAAIDSIYGYFITNSALTDGGAIYNYATESGISTIDSIDGYFITNSALTDGGAIYNYATDGGSSTIDSINGYFISNSASVVGGAIYNKSGGTSSASDTSATITSIDGYFTGNTAIAGGAIANYSATTGTTAKIESITGDFVSNYATKYGGAIYNDSWQIEDAVITVIYADFYSNYVLGDTGSTKGSIKGGAIYNNATIGTITGSFYDNYVVGTTSNDVAGGAIYTTTHLDFLADGQTNYFSNNYIAYYGTTEDIDTSTVDYNAIYVGVDTIIDNNLTRDITLTFTMTNGGSFVMNDSISGNTEYTEVTTLASSDAEVQSTTGVTSSGSVNFNGGTLTISYNNGSKDITYTASDLSTGDSTTKTTITNFTETSVTVSEVTTTTSTTSVTTYDNSGSDINYYTQTTTVTTIEDEQGSITTKTVVNDTTSYIAPTYADGTTITTTTTTTTSTNSTETATHTMVEEETTEYTGADSSNAQTTSSSTTITATIDETVGEETTTYTYTSTDSTVTSSITTDMTGETAYDVKIIGEGTDSIFYLNDEITNFGELSITNATLYLNGYKHTNGDITVGSLTALDSDSSVSFEKSQLTIDMSAYTASMSTDGSIPTTAVLTGNGAKLNIDDYSKLTLLNVSNGSTFTILLDFNADDIQEDDDGEAVAWNMNNVSIDSDLYTFEIIKDGNDDTIEVPITDFNGDPTGDTEDQVAYVISFEVNTESTLIHDSSISEIVYNAASDSNFSSDSIIPGERYLYDISTMSNDNEELAAVEGTVSLAKVAGVSTTTYRVNRLASDALSSRLSRMGDTDTVLASYDAGVTGGSGEDEGLGRLSKKEKSVALWFVPMYGHDKTSGASVAGFNADFVTNIYGGVAGVDRTFEGASDTGLGADLYRLGIAVHAGMGDTSTSGDFNHIDNDFHYGGAFIYGVAEYGNLTLSADLGFSKIVSEVNQDLSRYGLAGAKADVDSYAWNFDVRAEYCVETEMVNIIPYLGLELVSMQTEDYDIKRTDAAGGTIFNVTSDRQNVISVPLGVQFTTHITSANGWDVKPQLSIGAIIAMGDLDEDSTITMPGVAGSGHTSMEVVDPVTFDLAAGVSMAKDDWTFGLDYTFQKSENRTGHGLVGLIQYRF